MKQEGEAEEGTVSNFRQSYCQQTCWSGRKKKVKRKSFKVTGETQGKESFALKKKSLRELRGLVVEMGFDKGVKEG
jgi:hypothetical protein